MSFQALNVAASSLRSQQKAMDVVSHNIANVNTPGYSKQTANLATAIPERIGNIDFGRGVDLNSITRTVDPLINSAQQNNASQFQFWDTVSTGLNSIENSFGSLDSTGLSAAVNDFFLSWQQLSNNPQDTAQKYNVLSKTESLTMQLNNMQSQLSTGQQSLNLDINQQITDANLKIDAISSLSQQISAMEAGQISGGANDLRDQRDQIVRDLAKIIPIQEVSTKDGGLLIQTAGGDLLVQDSMAKHLARGTGASVNGFQAIVISGTSNAVQGLDQGGTIGGLLKLRDGNFGQYISSLDSFAANLAFSTNQLHSSASGGTRTSLVQSGQGAINPALALNDVTQGVAFAANVQAGSFSMHVYDVLGVPQLPTSQFTVNLAAGATMNDVANSINASVTGVTATVDAAGYLTIDAGTNTIAFGDDTSNFLAAYEINTFFHGSDSGNLAINANLKADASRIHTGRTDIVTSVVNSGDNSTAIAIMQLQDQSMSVDGSVASTLHERVATLSTQYGLDVSVAAQQRTYREAEATSLTQQREAISGVNVDEELVSMMKFQRAYEAAAKVINTNNSMLDALMGILR
ncbi:MAG: flagellar hook-associated protein FlgK [Zetaproteobacteria bacterium CG2_30_46_52]|nr:MAG: flagellar hook-associated protein FlgK [Zetaproteobacteria bacterium CG2_30_46_52]